MKLGALLICYQRFKCVEENYSYLESRGISSVIYVDGPKTLEVKEIQETFSNDTGFDVVLHDENMGVRAFVPYAISKAFDKFDYLIILEDDILINDDSLEFVMNISKQGYNMISLFVTEESNHCLASFAGGIWGWAVSKESWSKFAFTQENFWYIFYIIRKNLGVRSALYYAPLIFMSQRNLLKSWAFQWMYIRLKENILPITPPYSLSQNTGIGNSVATNTKRSHRFGKIRIGSGPINYFIEEKRSFSLSTVTGYSRLELALRTIRNYILLFIRTWRIGY